MYFKSITLKNFDTITEKLQKRYKLYETSLIAEDKCIESWDELKEDIPELGVEFGRLNVEPVELLLMQMQDNTAWEPHIDYHGPENLHIALNLPIFNCAGTYTNFYKNIKPLWTNRVKYIPAYKRELLSVNEDICELRATLELTSPHLVNVREIHGVSNPTDKIRFILSIRFKENPLHLWNE